MLRIESQLCKGMLPPVTRNQRRIAYAIGLISGFITGFVVYLGESGPRSVERFLLFTGGCLLGGYLLARVLVSLSPLESDATGASTAEGED